MMSAKLNIFQTFCIAVVLTCIGLMYVISTPAKASTYDGARLIDNTVFRDTNTMSVSSIQNFLDNMNVSGSNNHIARRTFTFDCYSQGSREREWYTAIGAPCDQEVKASVIIYYGSVVYGLNPQVVLATLQKEQSLITTRNPTERQLDWAMGYGCPTSSGCTNGDFAQGFFRQIDHGAWVLRWHYERASGNNSWWREAGWTCGRSTHFYKPSLYPNQNVRFYDQDDVHYRTYYLDNAATSSLYCYTPHAYNNPEGLYGLAKYGTTGRYYSGSRNFVTNFNNWFGSTHAYVDFRSMHNPRYLRLTSDVRRTNLRTGEPDGGTIPAGAEVYFSTRYTKDGELYLRTRIDTDRNRQRGVKYSDLENITPQYRQMVVPRYMEVAQRTRKVDPVTEAPTGRWMEPGEVVMLTHRTTVGGRLFLQTTHSFNNELPVTYPFDVMREARLDFGPMRNARHLKLASDLRKTDIRTNDPSGVILEEGREIYFDERVIFRGDLWVRTRVDTNQDLERAIRFTDLEEVR